MEDRKKKITKGRRVGVKKKFYVLLVQVVLIAMAVLALFPFLWMISTSLKGSEEAFAYPPKLIPEIFHWDNYRKAMTALPFDKAYLNSLKLAVINVTGQVLTSAL